MLHHQYTSKLKTVQKVQTGNFDGIWQTCLSALFSIAIPLRKQSSKEENEERAII